MNRRVLACFSIIVVLGGYAALSGGKSLTDASCGLGPPPDSPDFAEARAREAAELKREGYLRVCEANLARYDIASSLQSMERATAGLAFTPVALAGTPFAKLGSVGGMAESMSDVKSRLYRRFRFPDGRMVTLFEHDMSADGSQMYRDPREEPERINGLPARLLVMQANSGKAVSVLSWKEGRRFYEIWIDANVTLGNLRPQLFALAASLPASVAARANEPESLPPAFGPDGRSLHSFPATISGP
jgi:hypothetical protein